METWVCMWPESIMCSFFSMIWLIQLLHVRGFLLSVVKLYTTKSLSFALASIASYSYLALNLGTQTKWLKRKGD